MTLDQDKACLFTMRPQDTTVELLLNMSVKHRSVCFFRAEMTNPRQHGESHPLLKEQGPSVIRPAGPRGC